MSFPPPIGLLIHLMLYKIIAKCSTSLKIITFIKTQNNNNDFIIISS